MIIPKQQKTPGPIIINIAFVYISFHSISFCNRQTGFNASAFLLHMLQVFYVTSKVLLGQMSQMVSSFQRDRLGRFLLGASRQEARRRYSAL